MEPTRQPNQAKKGANKKEITEDTKEIKRIRRDHFTQVYMYKSDNLDEVNNFLENVIYKPDLQIEIKLKKDSLPQNKNKTKKKAPGPNSFTEELYQPFKDPVTQRY